MYQRILGEGICVLLPPTLVNHVKTTVIIWQNALTVFILSLNAPILFALCKIQNIPSKC